MTITTETKETSMVKTLVVLLGLMTTAWCGAQESSSQQTLRMVSVIQQDGTQPTGVGATGTQLIDAPTPAIQSGGSREVKDAGGFVMGVFGGGGLMGQGGAFVGGYSTGSVFHPGTPEVVFEFGMAAHTPTHTVDGIFSVNTQPTFNLDRHPNDSKHQHAFVFLNGGYTRFFATGNAADYGGGLILRPNGGSSAWFRETRFEYREYYLAGFGRQQTVRVSWEVGGNSSDD
jgi:hypothetical protein